MALKFLPVTKEELLESGIEQPDFIYISGDAYVDHSSFGTAIITRLLESLGYSVAIIAQPDWKDPASVTIFGEPRLAFIVSSGNMDSMVNHYTVNKKRRKKDAYSPGGKAGLRPDRAVIVYGNLIRKTYKKTPMILGGIEASLRRLGHYDYWSDKMRRSVLLDAGADLISYGMGERSIREIAEALDGGIPIEEITYIAGTVYRTMDESRIYDAIFLPSFEEISQQKKMYAESFYTQYSNTDPFTGKALAEYYKGQGYVVQNPPASPLGQEELDHVFALPFANAIHPSYEERGSVPAFSEIKFSITSCRGCFGSCSFCALTFHQGRIVQARSHESILKEALKMTEEEDFKGFIHDVGGPTGDFRHPSCQKQMDRGVCKHKQCLFPKACSQLNADHSDYLALLRKLRKLPKVKKVFIRSGIRFDYVLAEKKDIFLRELIKYHVSGQLRTAPEHVSDRVLQAMGKPEHRVYETFVAKYRELSDPGERQYIVPYFMSSHPGSHLSDAVALAEYIRDLGFMPEQVQDFYPTPSTLSTVMYHTGLDPRTMEAIYVPKSFHEKAMQRALLQYRLPANRHLVEEALTLAHRKDLIGFSDKCLIRPQKDKRSRNGFEDGWKATAGKGGKGRSRPYESGQKKAAKRKKKTIRSVHKKK